LLIRNCKNAIILAHEVLTKSIEGLSKRAVTPMRAARIQSLLVRNDNLATSIVRFQQTDGGWADVEETIWCVHLLMLSRETFESHVKNGLAWLKSMQHEDGGWGLSERDLSRIPTTCLCLALLPALVNEKALRWLAGKWENDLHADIKLTYKGGFTLMALAQHRDKFQADELVAKTIKYLEDEQNKDGGYGPWKGHPIGSDPWSTGITLVGLTAWPDRVKTHTVERAVEWLCGTQLESGLWPYHFIDEGSAYAYWGLVKAIEFLERTAV